MNVLVTTTMSIPHAGGASTHIELLCSGLQTRGHASRLLSALDARPSLGWQLFRFSLRTVARDTARALHLKHARRILADRIEQLVSHTGPHIIHAHDPLAACAALDSAGNTPVIQTVHGPWSREALCSPTSRYYRSIHDLEAEAFSGVALLLPVDIGQADILRSDYAVSPSRIQVVENAVDCLQVAAAAAAPFSRKRDYFLVPRRLVPKNGVEYAIRALSSVSLDCDLLIAGDGELRPSLEHLAKSLGIAERVRFLGDVPQAHLFPMMKHALSVIVPSVPANGVIEATSLAVLEGLASGTLVIGSAIGGIQQILSSCTAGILTSPGDTAAITNAMITIVNMSPDERAARIANGTRRVQSAYGIERWLDQIESAYLIAQTHRRLPA